MSIQTLKSRREEINTHTWITKVKNSTCHFPTSLQLSFGIHFLNRLVSVKKRYPKQLYVCKYTGIQQNFFYSKNPNQGTSEILAYQLNHFGIFVDLQISFWEQFLSILWCIFDYWSDRGIFCVFWLLYCCWYMGKIIHFSGSLCKMLKYVFSFFLIYLI